MLPHASRMTQTPIANDIGACIHLHPPLTYGLRDNAACIINHMQNSGERVACVIDAHDQLCGLITEHSILTRIYETHPDPMHRLLHLFKDQHMEARDLMTRQPLTLDENSKIENAFHLFLKSEQAYFPVRSASIYTKIKGIISGNEICTCYYDTINRRMAEKDMLLNHTMNHESYGVKGHAA